MPLLSFSPVRLRPALALALAAIALACDASPDDSPIEVPPDSPWEWDLPPDFPRPRVPEDNPMGQTKVELGRRLFYDTRLSANETQSCASCHKQELAFTEGIPMSIGSTGETHPRNSMSLTNVAYNTTQTWANPLLLHLEEQALIPIFGSDPVELGMEGKEDELLARLRADPDYPELFRVAFQDLVGELTIDRIAKALGAFQRALLSARSPYDRFFYERDVTALSPAALRGFELFFSEKMECFHCHGGFNFNSSSVHDVPGFVEVAFHNNGLYNLDGEGAYPPGNQGVYDITFKASDMGRFKAPTLRNIEFTAPYMHDGSIATLEEVLDHYAAGGRLIESGPLAGDGRNNPNKSEFIRGFSMSPEEKADLLTFLHALSDHAFITDPRFSDPFQAP